MCLTLWGGGRWSSCMWVILILPLTTPSHPPTPTTEHGSATRDHLFSSWKVILCNPWDYSPPGSSVHGILQRRILQWVAMPCSRRSSWLRDRTQFSCIAGRCFIVGAAMEAPVFIIHMPRSIKLKPSLAIAGVFFLAFSSSYPLWFSASWSSSFCLILNFPSQRRCKEPVEAEVKKRPRRPSSPWGFPVLTYITAIRCPWTAGTHVDSFLQLVSVLREMSYLQPQQMTHIPEMAAAMFSSREFYQQLVAHLELTATWYNKVMKTLLEVEFPLVQEELQDIDLRLRAAEETLSWKTEGNRAPPGVWGKGWESRF